MLRKFKEAWFQRHLMGQTNKQRELAQFLPAALEIQETPPNPLARWLMFSIIALVALGIIWMFLGKVNIVASAEGKIIPSSRVKQIQPLSKATVKNILVKEGEYVKQGSALIELDDTLTRADQLSLAASLEDLTSNAAVNEQLLALLEMPRIDLKRFSYQQLQTVADKNNIDTLTANLIWQRWQQYLSQYSSLLESQRRVLAESAAAAEQVSKLTQTLPISRDRLEKFTELAAKNYVSDDEVQQLRQQTIEQSQDLKSEQERAKQLEASQREIVEQINAFTAQTKSELLTQLKSAKNQIASIREEITKADRLNSRQILYAPVSGRVQELAVSTIGGVVTEAQQLMVIVPVDEALEVEVFLENKDIGFVREGMPAEIKIHTFPFTKYGMIRGEVLTVSDDATLDEQRGLMYRMRVLMKEDQIIAEGRSVKLIPGMTVTAEMQTGHRRIIEFFLAPLLRYRQEGLRER